MRVTDVIGFILLMVTITSAVTAPGKTVQELSDRTDKLIKRRDTTLILEEHHARKPVKQAKVVYRKITKHRINRKPAHMTTKPSRRPPTKQEHSKQSYIASLTARQKSRQVKPPKYGRYKGYKSKTNHYSPEKNLPHKYAPQPFNPPTGFGEPPKEFEDYAQKTSFGEPPRFKINDNVLTEEPIHSFGTSFTHNVANSILTSHGLPIRPNNIEEDFKNEKEYLQWQSYLQNEADRTRHSNSKKHATYSNPIDEGDYDAYPLKSYSDVYNYGKPQSPFPQDGKKKMFNDRNKLLNQPWVSNKIFSDSNLEVIGGQYAEPPARVTSKFHQSASMFNVEDDFGLDDLEGPNPEPISPYVNYKNSNMAFSPQNLNDAFSL